MEKSRYPLILELLVLGFDPFTGQALPEDHLCRRAEVAEALHAALTAMKEAGRQNGPQDHQRAKGSREWTQWEDERLRELYEADESEEEMARLLGRRVKAIRSRLTALGLKPDLSRRDMRWIPEEDDELLRLFEKKVSLSHIARILKRPVSAVKKRMERLELIYNGDDYPEEPDEGTRHDQYDLKQKFLAGMSVAEIAHLYQMPERAVRARLFYAGLSHDAPVAWRKK